jgi:protoporphyrinogen IX oxidase
MRTIKKEITLSDLGYIMDFAADYYLWIKVLHILAFISWMAGMLYLPRLFVYHVGAAKGSDTSETFKIMERRLLRYIMTPAMIVTFLTGGAMIMANSGLLQGAGWMHAKLLLVLCMAGLHGFFAVTMKKFARDENARSATFYRWANEAPTVLMILIVILVIVRPF